MNLQVRGFLTLHLYPTYGSVTNRVAPASAGCPAGILPADRVAPHGLVMVRRSGENASLRHSAADSRAPPKQLGRESYDLAMLSWEGTTRRQKCWLQASSLASFLPATL